MMLDFSDYDPEWRGELKMYQADDWFWCDAYASLRLYKKEMWNQSLKTVKEIGKFPWELNVISSSDEEDNDSSEEESDEGGESEPDELCEETDEL